MGTVAVSEDHTLNEAIQASLQDFKEDIDLSPLKNAIREGGRFGLISFPKASDAKIHIKSYRVTP